MKWGISAMPSKTSLFNREIFLQILRSVGWISIVYFLGLLIAVPIRMMMMYTEENHINPPPPFDSLFQYDFDIQITLLIVIPVLMSVFLFRYLQVRQAADLMHSLPIRREKLFHHYYLSGAALLIIPVVLITVLVLITQAALDLNEYFKISDVWYWAGTTIIVNLTLYSAGVFVAMMTGISAVQGVLTYIFLLFPGGITLLVSFNLRKFLYGYPADYFLNKDLEKLSPLTHAAILDGRPLHWDYAIFYLILAFVLYGLSLFFYKKRKIEAAQEAIAFSNLKAVFKYGVTFCMMLFGGVYFSEVQNSHFGWIIFGYFLGGVIGYFVAEMVLQKTWRVFTRIKGLVIYAAVIVVVVTTVQFLGIYENKLPEQNQVNSVLFSNNPNVFTDHSETYTPYFVPVPMKDKENIIKVMKLHKQILSDKKSNQRLKDGQYETAFFMYTLNNGDKMVRQYNVSRAIYEDYYRSIYESEEFKKGKNEIFQLNEKKAKTIAINSNTPFGKTVTISDSNEIKEVIHALQSDILQESYEDEFYYQDRGIGIEIFTGKTRSIYFNYNPTYQNLTNWLKNKELYDQVIVNPEDIDYLLVAKMTTKGDFIDPTKIIKQVQDNDEAIKITDKEQIGQLINRAGTWVNHQYVAVISYKNKGNYQEVYFYDERHAPDFIKKHFK
jgi:ABC-2 type transport system permease protein